MYEIVSDMSTRQDTLEERLVSVEDKLAALQEQLELLPEALTRCIAQHAERMEQRRNFLHPDAAVALATPLNGVPGAPANCALNVGMSGSIATSSHHPLSASPLLPHSRSVPSAPVSLHPWPASPVLPPISSRTPHLVPETPGTRVVHASSQSAGRIASQSAMNNLGTSQGSDGNSPRS